MVLIGVGLGSVGCGTELTQFCHPGRFDREIDVSDRNVRLEILQIHTRGMPLAKDVNLERLADISLGFVGADLQSLSKEAAIGALKKYYLRYMLLHSPRWNRM